ncbi:MAG TPA: AI-2E family transporter, partial [Burkholderiales bacterium]|nr:AI-2E family transporter [Burkholderiales bacterium]
MFAIVCAPLFRWLRRAFGGRGSLAAATTLVLIVVVVIVPMIFLSASIVREASELYQRVKSGGLGNYVRGS